jgi:2-polyprenyl-3-methyl-5-hydroxy-6-metoxy-1,4-benzoquinol methylase
MVQEHQFPSKTEQEDFWNSWITQFREDRPIALTSLRQGATVLEWLSALYLKNPNILELGCGSGWMSELLSSFGPCTGVDLAHEVIARARARAPHINFIADDVLAVDLPSQHFDVIVSLEAIAHVPDQQLFAERVKKWLKPGGYLLLGTQNNFVMSRSSVALLGQGQIRNWPSRTTLKCLFEPELRILKWKTVNPPDGYAGFLHLVNSVKLNSLLERVLLPQTIGRLKERMGLGKTLMILFQRQTPAPTDRPAIG